MSNHLIQVKNPAFRHAITKIRCSSHLLNIERGRHSKPKIPIEQRKCYFCNSLEDEIHFVIDCMLYKNDRCILFDNITKLFPDFIYLDSTEKFEYLFKSNDPNVLNW